MNQAFGVLIMIKLDKKEIWPVSIILLTLLAGIAVYGHLPDRVATHWDIDGAVNGWSGRTTAVVLLPGMMLFVYLLLLLIPSIDPLKKNIESFSRHFRWFRTYFLAALAVLQLIILANGLGIALPVGSAVMLMMAALFFLIARLLPETKRNYTIGIRVPWTLECDQVWDETHRFGGRVFSVLAAVAAAGALLPGRLAFVVFFGAVMVGVAVTIVFSYWRYRDIHRGRR